MNRKNMIEIDFEAKPRVVKQREKFRNFVEEEWVADQAAAV
jgi:hypothetical protein